MGFNEGWINLEMKCVTSVSYSILFNGFPSETVYPSRDGDPLSPYLFLICAEGLSALIRRAALQGDIFGLKVCHKAPPITHRFFADDSLLFAKANLSKVNLLRLISSYESVSGQKVNMEKSGISFRHCVRDDVRQMIQARIGVIAVEKFDKYLGFAAVVERLLRWTFDPLSDRVCKKLSG